MASAAAARMIQENTDHGDAWTSEQIALIALEDGDTFTAEQFAQIHAETYGDVDARLAHLV
jgi:hypothetical protein